jgi:hypothetical protein
VSTHDIGIVTLPLSGWRFEVRPDRSWRELGPTDWSEGDDEDWVSATEYFDFNGRVDGDGWHGPTWWLLYGNVPRGTPVAVKLADGTHPEIREFGPLWLCEWASLNQPAVVTIGDASSTIFDRAPSWISPDV